MKNLTKMTKLKIREFNYFKMTESYILFKQIKERVSCLTQQEKSELSEMWEIVMEAYGVNHNFNLNDNQILERVVFCFNHDIGSQITNSENVNLLDKFLKILNSV